MTIAPLLVSRRTSYRSAESLALRTEPYRAAERLAAHRLAAHRLTLKTTTAIAARIGAYYPRSPAITIAVQGLRGLVQLLPFPLVFSGGSLVAPAVLVRRFTREAAVVLQPVGVEPSVGDRRGNRAPRLRLVHAVGEAAVVRQRLDLVERRVEPIAVQPRLQLAHARRVDQQRASGQRHQTARGRGMAAFAVFGADRGDA